MANDTQWPRYVVFQQPAPDKPYQYVGSVHAPDAEMALLNARDVFVRRPVCNGLWVVPASSILTRTLEELAQDSSTELAQSGAPDLPYHVFLKLNQAGPVSLAGDVSAPTAGRAMQKALIEFRGARALWWWVVPEAAITRTEAADVEVMFEPAADKTAYRDQGNFRTLSLLNRLRANQEYGMRGDDS